MANHKHLTIHDRIKIENSLNNNLSFKAIGSLLGKDCTTISKEVRGHRVFEKKGAPYRPFNDCVHRAACKSKSDFCPQYDGKGKCDHCSSCRMQCGKYKKETCPRLAKPPYVCNGCDQRCKCTLEKCRYDAGHAQKEYEEVRSESRSGVNLTEEDLMRMDSVVSPLIKQGQSLHHVIVHNRDRISCCEKSLYKYANDGLLSARNIDMPRKVRFRPRKKKSVPLKVDRSCRVGRAYEDYQKYLDEHPAAPVVELDTVEGKQGCPVLLTIHFVRQHFQLAFLREANDSRSVTQVFECLYEQLGRELYEKLFGVLLADNGSEFSNPKAIEFDKEGRQRSHVFYCHPSSPGEKGACEVNHEFIRRVIPKGVDIGQHSAEQIALMMNHINSYSRPDLENKSPYEMMQFYYGRDIPARLGVQLVAPKDIVLKPSLLQGCEKSESGAGTESRDSTLGANAAGQPLTQ